MSEMNFNAGDKVRFRLALNEVEGIVLESPENASDIVLIKLESGYNIGINKENILGSRVLKKFKEEENELVNGEKEDYNRENREKAEKSINDKSECFEQMGDERGARINGDNLREEVINGKNECLDNGSDKIKEDNNDTSLDKGKEKYGNKKGLKSIGLVITGGTIAAKLDSRTGGVSWLTDVNEFMRFYPELEEIVNVKKIDVPFMIASENMSSEHWIKIAESVKKMLDDNEIEGVIVTHGTDFLHYTSSALSFFLQGLNKPVVLTYSQRSIDRASSDARLNLVCSAHMALSECAEVMVVGHASINDEHCFAIRGTKAKKMHSSRRDAFKPINDTPIAKVFGDGKIQYFGKYNKRDNQRKVKIDTSFCDKIALVKFYPGQDASILDFYALKYKGIIVEAAGLGHLPTDESNNSWIVKLKKHIRNGFVVCAAAQTTYGRLDPFVYSNGRKLVDAGVIFLEDMLSECAFVKLGWVLGHYGWKEKAGEKMRENVAGEFNEKLGKE